MMRTMRAALLGLVALAPGALAQTAVDPAVDPASEPETWREVDPENLLIMDTSEGRIHIETAPDLAPLHVERYKTLAREGFYDGIIFHRVIDDFMAQGGDPLGTGYNGSDKPDVTAEFSAKISAGADVVEVAQRDMNPRGAPDKAMQSFRHGFPIAHRETKAAAAMMEGGAINSWVLHCPGIASTARDPDNPNSGNSQFFLMRYAAPGLNEQYSVWGRVVSGLDVVRALAVGEPPPKPSKIEAMVVAADLEEGARDRAWVMRSTSPAFAAIVEAAKAEAAPRAVDICDIEVPAIVEVNAETLSENDEIDDLFESMRPKPGG